jgi:XTP/dITP diphosphohydrolase
MIEIVLATGNPHKVEELRAIFAAKPESPVRIIGLADVPNHASFREPVESGGTFEKNAWIKAESYAAQTGRVCLADDSGLEIDALSGRPGVISSHYSTDGRETGLGRAERDRLNIERVMSELAGVPVADRTARFVCVMALAAPPGASHRRLAEARATFEGRIGLPGAVPRGAHGFGYDPIFLVAPDFACTGAELEPELKNRLSHRAKAAAIMAGHLSRLARVRSA